jgi:hypothetical protein
MPTIEEKRPICISIHLTKEEAELMLTIIKFASGDPQLKEKHNSFACDYINAYKERDVSGL